MTIETTQPLGGGPFKRGARRSPRHKLLAAEPFKKEMSAPSQFAVVPSKLDMWGNDQYGDCVSAEEAFAKATADTNPETFIDSGTVVDWAARYGFRDGANLTDVMDQMARDGFHASGTVYGDGPYKGVDYSNEAVLQAAICVGPVKIAIDANALPSGAGNKQGWSAFGGGNYPNTDHCVSLPGFGPAEYLFGLLGVPVPSGAPSGTLYLLYTWSTIGVVDHKWLMGTCTEAWVRQPTSTNGGSPMPQPSPTPTPTPQPPQPPAPPPSPIWQFIVNLLQTLGPVILPILIQWLQALLHRAQIAQGHTTQEVADSGRKHTPA